MNLLMQRLQALLGPNAKAVRSIMAPLVVVMILAMMVLPLPAFALDLLFTFNIAMALMVMMVAAYMVRPLDFAAFPSVILLTTLLRLSLNVASTRVVLLQGHTGAGAAGAVIESFGHFLIGGNFAVGLIVFAILVVINFIVVTKGAERIAEVGEDLGEVGAGHHVLLEVVADGDALVVGQREEGALGDVEVRHAALRLAERRADGGDVGVRVRALVVEARQLLRSDGQAALDLAYVLVDLVGECVHVLGSALGALFALIFAGGEREERGEGDDGEGGAHGPAH